VIRLLIVEDHPAIAEGLAALIGATQDIDVVGVTSDESEARQLIARQSPDVVLCDVMLNGRDAGFDLLRAHRGDAAFVMYSAFDYPAHHVKAIEGGAAGYLPKTAEVELIVRAIGRAAAGEHTFPPDVLDSARRAPRPPTRRERELLVRLAAGATNEDLAAALGLRVKSVEGMLRRLFDRYGTDNRTQLARYASQQGWLTGGLGDDAGPGSEDDEDGIGDPAGLSV
jgi:DNA-binding NarL/FixJ family response regulator